jgi:lipocalin
MDVINKCKVDGKPRIARGVARSVSDDNKHLKVSFFPPFEGDYVIKKIDPKYENVTVESGDTVWKLRRS